MNKSIPIKLNFILIVFGLLLLGACGPKSETKINIQTEATAMGPFFAGPNSFIAEYEVDLSSIEGLEGVNKEQLKAIGINSIKVILRESDSLNFDSFHSASLQLVGANTGMQSIAIKNPISSGSQESSLDVSNEADIVDYFKNDKISFVLDLDFVDDSYADELGAIIELDLTVKHN
jgi:hypothetical protein